MESLDSVLMVAAISFVVGVALLIMEYRTRWFARAVPGTDALLEAAENRPRVYKVVVRIWGFVPRRFKTSVLRRVNPSVALGALAVIIDPYSATDDPSVLLGWHTYQERDNIPWALLGGALKKRDREVSDPAQTVVREVWEETGLEVDVVKLSAIDTDWGSGTMDFYFECALRKGYPDLTARLPTPEVTKLGWFRVSELPGNMSPQHKKWLEDVLTGLPRLPGVSWTAHQESASWWDRLHKAERTLRLLLSSAQEPMITLCTLVQEAQSVLNCDVVSLFVAEPPIEIVSPDFGLPSDIEGSLRLVLESSTLRGALMKPPPVLLPLSQPSGKKLGLTAWLVRARPLGRATRLHEEWLHNHEHVRSWRNHDHLSDRICHSLAAVSVLGRNRVLGLLKAENKMRHALDNDSDKYVPFAPDDGYIMEEFAEAAASLLEDLIADTSPRN